MLPEATFNGPLKKMIKYIEKQQNAVILTRYLCLHVQLVMLRVPLVIVKCRFKGQHSLPQQQLFVGVTNQ
jgi:hypothetical protein